MAQWMSLSEVIAALVQDGDCVALEGFTHLIPFAAGHEARTAAAHGMLEPVA
jgi:glutaconate CoA-transferase subunit A